MFLAVAVAEPKAAVCEDTPWHTIKSVWEGPIFKPYSEIKCQKVLGCWSPVFITSESEVTRHRKYCKKHGN